MNKDYDRKKAQPERKQIPAAKEKQQIKSTELTDADLDKVSWGAASTRTVGGTGSVFETVDLKFIKVALK